MLLYNVIVTFVSPGGSEFELRYGGLFSIVSGTSQKAESLLPLTILLLAIPALAFVTLLLFKFRKLQLRLSMLTLLLLIGEVILIAYYLYYVIAKYDVSVLFSLKITYPPVAAVLMYLAFRAILKDELLVRSYDRIR
jgi:hypothetical protein